MERIDATIQEVEYQAKAPKRPPVSAPKPPNGDYPTSAREWIAYRAKAGGQPIEKVCPECANLGYLKDETGKAVRCQTCTEPERRDWLKQHCGIEPPHQAYTLNDWRLGGWSDLVKQEQRQTAKGAIEQVIERRAGLLTYWGDFGSGKTFALQIIANELRGQMVESYYTPLAFVLDHLRQLFAQGRDWSHYWQRLLDVPVLCLDEVTKFHETSWAMERLFVLADTRYSRRTTHLTVFATNDDPGQSLPVTDGIGYLFSRMRQGAMIELRGDMRRVVHQNEARAWRGQ